MISYLEYTEFMKFLAAAKKLSHNVEPIAAVMGFTGLRISEALSLTIDDVTHEGQISRMVTVHGSATKTKQAREIVINDQLEEILSRYLFHRMQVHKESAILFPGPQGRRLSARAIQKAIRKIGYESLGRHVTPHTFRHTFGTLLARRASIRVVQAALGHASLNSTQIYTHVNRQDLKNAVDVAFQPPEVSHENHR